MNKNAWVGIVTAAVIVVLAVGIFWFTQNQNTVANTPSPAASGTATQAAPSAPPAATASTSVSVTIPPAGVPAPATYRVAIQGFAFNPATLTVKAGDTVIWTNKDAMAHTVTGDNGGPASSSIGPNGTYSFTFRSAGTFNYHCAIHPSMHGTVVVAR